MTTPFIGEIQLFGFHFNPRGWAFCDGSTLQVRQNTALFSLLGTRFGGNGSSTFMLPNFAARSPCALGQGIGLSRRDIGEDFGAAEVTLARDEMPTHGHTLNYFSQNDASKRHATPVVGDALSVPTADSVFPFVDKGPFDLQFPPGVLGETGGSQAHPNQQPYLAVNFCIALEGVFPAFG